MSQPFQSDPDAGGLIFRALYRGSVVTVGRADTTEIAELVKASDQREHRDFLDRWSLIAIRYLESGQSEVHALGWRRALENTWITSVVKAIHSRPAAVCTQSGHIYLLGKPVGQELDPDLYEHLQDALEHWRFTDVAAAT